MNWMLEIAEQKAVHGIDHQASVVRERSLLLAEETLSNTLDFVQKLGRMREPQELAHFQSEFVGRQAQVVGHKTKELGERMVREAMKVTTATMQGGAESVARQ